MLRKQGRGFGRGSKDCTCPKCGFVQPYKRGIPCSQLDCPKCSTPMRGIFCN